MTTKDNHLNRFISESHDREKNLWRNNLILLITLIGMVFIVPVLPLKEHFLFRTVLSIVVLSGLFAAEFSKKIFGILFSIGMVVISFLILSMFFPDSTRISIVAFSIFTIFIVLVTLALIFHIGTATKIERSTILCAINSFILIGLTAALLFLILDLFIPHSFTNIVAVEGNFSSYLYFAYVTITTLGYGDILPETPIARSLSTFFAVLGQLYLVIVIAMIIGKYLNSKRPNL